MFKLRYTVKFGKYGSYFFDTFENKDLSLDEVVQILNSERPELKQQTLPIINHESHELPEEKENV